MLPNRDYRSYRARNGAPLLALVILGIAMPRSVAADVITEWNEQAVTAIHVTNTNPVLTPRLLAILHGAMFDAVNSVDHAYGSFHIALAPAEDTSRRAAAAQAAYTVLVNLFPSQQAAFDAELSASMAEIAADPRDDEFSCRVPHGKGDGNDHGIANGIALGVAVARDILAWRSADGLTATVPDFFGGTAPGQWRPTVPNASLPMVFPQMATVVPFVIRSPSQFRPPGPPPLTSVDYAVAFNEVKSVGRKTGSTRTSEQTDIALFWSDNGSFHANQAARIVSDAKCDKHTRLVDRARAFALLNVAAADSVIAGWDAKIEFDWWRPITAIQLADTDGNADTASDSDWQPLLSTPRHPDYTSNHSAVSGSAATVLAGLYGDENAFTLDAFTLPGKPRSFSSFSSASDEVNDARVYGGIHTRYAVVDGQTLGKRVGAYVLEQAMGLLGDGDSGEHEHGESDCRGQGEISEDGE
jgi:hypothetical protein